MNNSQERILIVEEDPEISDLIARQVLKPLGYRVKLVYEAPLAIQAAIDFAPDVMIVNLNLTGLSGKDLMVALSSQGLNTPVIVIAGPDMERDVIQAFRVGASDYLGWPIREAEVVSAVERALKQVRAQRERERLTQKINEVNQKLQSRVRELTTIMGIGKAVTSITDRNLLFDKIIEGAVFISEADKGWLLLRKSDHKTFYLSAQKNLPHSITIRKGQPWDDGISSLVALSGESLSIHGSPLRRFKVAGLGKSALVVPVKIQKEIVGLMVVVRNDPRPFSPGNKNLLELLADFASISLVNVQLFQAVEDRARSLQALAELSQENQRIQSEIFANIYQALETPLVMLSQEVGELAGDQQNSLDDKELAAVSAIRQQLPQAMSVLNEFSMAQKAISPLNRVDVNLIDLVQQAITRNKPFAKEQMVNFHLGFPSEPVFVSVDIDKMNLIFDIMLSQAIRMSANSKVVLEVLRDNNGNPQVNITDSSPGMSKNDMEKIVKLSARLDSGDSGDGNIWGTSLVFVKYIIQAHGGQIWVDRQTGQGSTFHFTLKSLVRI